MLHKTFFFVVSLVLLSWYLPIPQEVSAKHTNIFIPILEMDPKSPIAGQQVSLTTVVTNLSNEEVKVVISYNLDGTWIIDDVKVDIPAKKSASASFTATIPVKPGNHELRACPDRQDLGDDGDQCQKLNFVAIDESTISVAIISPQDNTVLNGSANFSVVALGQDAQRIELYIENELVDTKNQAPFDFTIDTTKFDDGRYSVYAIAYYDSGLSKPSSVKRYTFENGGAEVVRVTLKSGLVQAAEAKVGQSVVIESVVTNDQPFVLPITYIAFVKDAEGFSEFLSWKEERFSINQTLPMSRTWVPDDSGGYSVEVFLWNTLENALPLSDVMLANVVVKEQA